MLDLALRKYKMLSVRIQSLFAKYFHAINVEFWILQSDATQLPEVFLKSISENMKQMCSDWLFHYLWQPFVQLESWNVQY
jgi:hypothetical protein